MRLSLNKIAEIRFGFYGKPLDSGNLKYIQARYFDSYGNIVTQPDSFINYDEKVSGHILLDGDILFISKGFRYFSWCYDSSFGPAVASSIFFVIRPDKSKVLPQYLNTFFNMPKNQEFFKNFGAGSSIPSIRKSELGGIIIPVLPLDEQKKIVLLNSFHQKNIEISQALIQNKVELYQAILSKILK